MKIVLAVGRYPWPPRRGDQMRTVQLAELLAGDHEIRVLSPRPAAGAPPPPRGWPATLALYRPSRRAQLRGLTAAALGGLPLQAGLFHQPELAVLLAAEAVGADLVVLQLARLAGHLSDVVGPPVVIDLIDSLALNIESRVPLAPPLVRPLLAAEARRLGRLESRLVADTAVTLVVAERDRRGIVGRLSTPLGQRVHVLPLIVDPAERRAGDPPPLRLPGSPALVFSGNLGYFPNRDALDGWLTEVWPTLRSRLPGAELTVAGSRAGASLRRRLEAPGLHLVDSPPDLQGLLGGADVAIAPLRCGSGVPVKILEAWAAGTPVVASRWAVAGTSATPGVELLMADGAAEWIAALERLREPGLRRALGVAAGVELVRQHGPGAVARSLRRALAPFGV